MLKSFGDVESKFKFVVVASKRAKQLLKGAKPKLKTKSKSFIRIAQEEVKDGLVDYDIVQRKKEEEYRSEDEDFIGEEIVREELVEKKVEAKPKTKSKKADEKKKKPKSSVKKKKK